MRLARKLFLIAATAIAVIAFASPVASAVTITAEPGGANCPEVQVNNSHAVTGGCLATFATTAGGELTIRHHYPPAAEAVISICSSSFSMRVHRSGDGWLFNQALGTVNCFVVPCDEAEGVGVSHANYEWPVTFMEFGPFNLISNPSNEAIQVTFCIRPLGSPDVEGSSFGTCTVFIPIVQLSTHSYRFTTLAPGPGTPNAGARSASRCSQDAGTSVSGNWQITSTPLELTH